jgi:transposase
VPIVSPETGEVRLAHDFVAALGASNCAYACATVRETQTGWLRDWSQALQFFRGVPWWCRTILGHW